MTNLENCENPRIHGKALVENHSGEWRYRIGDYPVLALIDDDNIKISVIRIGH
ncbi:type II toxin-antitoxin system RelE family toxin [Lactococcus termiticola]|uniref:type II toxin-antitoxin system RelE family toxin n=1 Tax=Lactococcus termiticola TaxID=2169526 RepID=UPI000D653CC1|nr:type II toxin-antitoxin system RelE/ParE family toxin [Lactococcus termiticola]